MWLGGLVLIMFLAAGCANGAPDTPALTSTTPTTVAAQVTDAATPRSVSKDSAGTVTPSATATQTATFTPTATDTLTPSPTATDTPTPSPTPTATPSPTPTPTPTPLPDARLRLGRTFQEQGNYEAAIGQFQGLLADPAAELDEAAEARYRLGQCYALDGNPSSATAAFQDFLDAHPDDPHRLAAYFQLAEAYVALEEWEAAVEGYQTYLAERDAIASAVHERIGDAYVKLRDDERALESYKAALESASYLDQVFALREKIADLHLRNAGYDLAIAQYEDILEAAQSETYRAQVEYLLGHAYLLADDADAAYLHWSTAVALYPKAHHAYLSLVELVNAGVEVDELQRGMVDYYAGVYGAAVQALYRYLESDVTERRDEARYYVGRAYHLSGSYSLAINEYDALIAAYPDSPLAGGAWLEKARSLAAQGRTDDAGEVLAAFVEAYPDHELAPEALWRMARQHENSAAWAEAASAYRRLQQNYPTSERAAESLFRAGLSHFRLSDYEAAVEVWRQFVTGYPDADRLSATRYWLGRAYGALDDAAEANRWLALAAKSSSFLPDYYTLRAGHRLASLKAGVSSDALVESWPLARPSLLLDFDEVTARAEAEAWMLDWADPEGEVGDLSVLMDALAQDRRYQRALEYLAVGLQQDALDEFEIMRVARRDEPLIMYGLAVASQELGAYKTSIRCALQVMNLSPVHSLSDAPRFLQHLAYPIYFDDLVLAEAAAHGLDPLLVFALIRQESLFESGALSYAQAIGLMQVIPATGDWIALRLGWEDFAADHLTRPYVNLRFGTWYLIQGLNAFQGNVFAALAAYNSGIGAPGRWLDVSGDDPDIFVETIEYSQTWHYVQLVYQHHALYRHIYQPGG